MGACLGRCSFSAAAKKSSVDCGSSAGELLLVSGSQQMEVPTVVIDSPANTNNGRLSEPDSNSNSNSNTTVAHYIMVSFPTQEFIDQYVLEIDENLSYLADLQEFAESEAGWMMVITSLINCTPLENHWGPCSIAFVLKESALPSKENTTQISKKLGELTMDRNDIKRNRNACILIGCLADLLAGQNRAVLLNNECMNYLISWLNPDEVAHVVILFAIIALERLAQTAENKIAILEALGLQNEHPLRKFEEWANSNDNEKRQIGFCSKWLLDNILLVKGRPYGFQLVDNTNIHAILNSDDTTPCLKISPDGLEARNDTTTFESIRCTFQIDSGIWYYEVLIMTEGVMQIGWSTKNAKFLNLEEWGSGVGDDSLSVGIDGCRQLLWYGANATELIEMPIWKSGDIMGTILDLDMMKISFFLNGKKVATHKEIFDKAKSEFFAAASFWTFQQCQFNFGNRPFEFPPSGKNFRNFNECGSAKLESYKVERILPRHMRLNRLQNVEIEANSCNICADHITNTKFLPCKHTGICSTCAAQLVTCPFCREAITEKVTIYEK